LLITTVLAGAFQLELGWPIACYPTFQWIEGPTMELLETDVVSAAGETIAFKGRALTPQIPPERYRGLVNQVLRAKSGTEREVRIEALWRLFVRNSPRLEQAETVRFYQVTRSAMPDRQREDPVGRKLLLEWKPKALR
jgi:hypothetical protein